MVGTVRTTDAGGTYCGDSPGRVFRLLPEEFATSDDVIIKSARTHTQYEQFLFLRIPGF